jgi:hypothetical protein
MLRFSNFELVNSDFDKIYQDWIACQFHIHKDRDIEQIVDCVVNNINLDWSDKNLTVVDEGIIQMRLRDLHNLDLLCYNLNVFPKNTFDLRKVLIDV